MDRLRAALGVCRVQSRKNLLSPRVGALALLTGLLISALLEPICSLASELGLGVPPFAFPFLICTDWPQMLFAAGAVLLFCNAPFYDGATRYMLPRISVTAWWAGNLLFILWASFLYTAFLWLVSLLSVLPRLDVSSTWGDIWETVALGSVQPAYIGRILLTADNFVRVWYAPIEATLYTFLLEWGCFAFIGLCVYLGNRLFRQPVGLWLGAFFPLWDVTIDNMLPYLFYKSSPITLAQLSLYTPNMRPLGLTPLYSAAFFTLGIAGVGALVWVAEKTLRKNDLPVRGDELW
jgi:hypothetical protein